MMYNYRPGDSLTGSWTPQTFPYDTEITSGPAQYSLTTAEVKDFLRVNDSLDDLYIDLLIGAVQEQVERYMGLDTTIRTRRSYWMRTAGLIRLPYGPHGSITSVVSRDDDGNDTTLTAGTDYLVIGMKFKDIRLIEPTGGQILVTYESGHATVPPAIKGAMLQEISLQYKNRQDATPPRTSVNNLTIEARHLLAPYLRLDL